MIPGLWQGWTNRQESAMREKKVERAGKWAELMGEAVREEHGQRYDQVGWIVEVRM